ncbi:MAG: hypothetical protein Kow00127_06440 [Bacteroidales bacterium]
MFLTVYLLTLGMVTAAPGGWRTGEKQILVQLNNPQEATQLISAKIDFEWTGPLTLRAYVVDKELLFLQSLGLTIEVEIEDLNQYYSGFWTGEDAYHSYSEIIALADSLEENFPSICKRYLFGTDASGQYELTALKISDNVLVDEPEAEVMFDGGIHGDEIGGPENVIRFARDLCLAYGNDPDITELIDNREIWLYLMVNPWGRVNMTRYNQNGVDLNRDWSYMWDEWGGSTGPCSQPESKALRLCMYNNQFVVHTTYHSGTVYISCPWSYRPDQPHDWSHINQLAALYSNTSTYPNLPYGQGYNGMYAINGSTKDSNYGIMGSISWSMEISESKQPPASQIMLYYNRNYPAMLAMIEYAGYGLQGTITDAVSGEPVAAAVFVNDYMPTYSDSDAGDFHKYVLASTYDITVVANGYESETVENVVVESNSVTTVDVALTPGGGHYAWRLPASQIPGNNYSDEGWTPGVIGAPDGVRYSIGKNGWCVLDMQFPVIDGEGNDVVVYEEDSSPEGYTLFAGETIDGPWVSLGQGTGTQEFDLAGSGLTAVQFFKIVDDGDGSATASDAGFDLDAIEGISQINGVYLALDNYTIDDSNGNNNGIIDPGETVDLIVSIKNNGDAIAENTSGILTSASPYVTIIGGSAAFGSLAQWESGEGVFTLEASPGTPPGQVANLNLQVEANNGAYTNTYALPVTIGHIVEDWESGTMTQFDWTTGGNNSWELSTQSPWEGTYCIKSGDINDNQSSWLEIAYDVLAASEIGFYKKVSSESNYDYLYFYIDGTPMGQWSGEVSWSETVFSVTPGYHTFRWEYSKDQSVSQGSDCAWLDYITLPAGAITGLMASFAADQTEICIQDIVHFTDLSTGNITSWYWEFEGGSPATSSAQNPQVAWFNAGLYDVTLTVSDGSYTNTFVAEDYILVNESPSDPGPVNGQVYVITNGGPLYSYSIDPIPYSSQYEWSIDPEEAGVLNPDGPECDVVFTDSWSGNFNLTVTVTNNCGSGSATLEGMAVITGINDAGLSGLTIFPNPAKEIINLTLPADLINGDDLHLSLMGLTGNLLWEKEFERNSIPEKIRINTEKFPAGVYLVRWANGTDSGIQRVVVR